MAVEQEKVQTQLTTISVKLSQIASFINESVYAFRAASVKNARHASQEKVNKNPGEISTAFQYCGRNQCFRSKLLLRLELLAQQSKISEPILRKNVDFFNAINHSFKLFGKTLNTILEKH